MEGHTMEQDRKHEDSMPARAPATAPAAPAAEADDNITVEVVGDDGFVHEPADADLPDFNDDLDPSDAP
jgi:hypothetical protein